MAVARIFAFQTSSESVNPFNQFMSPAGDVNLYSGGAAFSFPLAGIKGVPDQLRMQDRSVSSFLPHPASRRSATPSPEVRGQPCPAGIKD
jgi:hypothetical protein